MIYEFTKKRSTAVAEIEPKLKTELEEILTYGQTQTKAAFEGAAIVQPLERVTPFKNGEYIGYTEEFLISKGKQRPLYEVGGVCNCETCCNGGCCNPTARCDCSFFQQKPKITIPEKKFTEKPSTAVMDIKPTLTDLIHANENFVESELHNDVLVVHQKENLLALETIFNKQESFKNWVISTRQEEIAALEKIIMEIPIEAQLIYDNLVKQLIAQEKTLTGFSQTHPVRDKLIGEIAQLKEKIAMAKSELGTRFTWQQQIQDLEKTLAGFHAGHYIRQSLESQILQLEQKINKPMKYKKMLIELKANTSKIILFDANNVLDPLIIDFIQKHDVSFLAWRSANLNVWLKIKGV